MNRDASMLPLAISGGEPAFGEPLHVGVPNILDPEAFLALCREALDRRWLTNRGPLVCRLEERVAELLEIPHVIAVANATLGLQVVFRALEVRGEVVMPSFTFVATAHAARWEGLDPYFADVDRATHNLDPGAVGHSLRPKTGAILGFHLWGRPCFPDALEEIAARQKCPLVFDAAHAFLSGDGERKIGARGDAEVFSLHATKFFNAGEGGLITTRNGELAARIRRMINFGFSGYDTVTGLGTNGKMNEFAAAMALSNLERIDACLAVNRRNHTHYREALASIPFLKVMDFPASSNHQYVVVEVSAESPLNRDLLCALLWSENVRARRYFTPGCHQALPYREDPGARDWHLPVTEDLCQQVLLLPTGTRVGLTEIETIAGILRAGFADADRVRQHFKLPSWPWEA